MPGELELSVITPERELLRSPVDYVTVPATEGLYGILPGHAPMIAALRPGVVHYRSGGERRAVAIAGGFLEVVADRVAVLADHAERAEEIDVAAARRDLEAIRQQLEAGGEAAELALARERLQHALARLRAAQRE